ncbi:MAG: hypothetical protein ACYCO3_04815 [Mycobacteriales bacterium]
MLEPNYSPQAASVLDKLERATDVELLGAVCDAIDLVCDQPGDRQARAEQLAHGYRDPGVEGPDPHPLRRLGAAVVAPRNLGGHLLHRATRVSDSKRSRRLARSVKNVDLDRHLERGGSRRLGSICRFDQPAARW